MNIPSPEIQEAVQKGVVDGISGASLESVYTGKRYEVAPYITDPGFGMYAASGTIMNKTVYDGLPPDIRKVFDEVTKEAVESWHIQLLNEDRAWTVDFLKKQPDVEFYHIPDAEKERWRNICVPQIWDNWLKETSAKGYAAQEFLDMYRSLIAKYSAMKSAWNGWGF